MQNRGHHPQDPQLFSNRWFASLCRATDDMVYLLSRGYGSRSAIAIVGDRYRLNKRQRLAILRMAASENDIESRRSIVVSPASLNGRDVSIDGLNVLILIEGALSGAYIFACRDGTYRDILGVHGSYQRVRQSTQAVHLIGRAFTRLGVRQVHWLLDRPVSNSGRLAGMLRSFSELHELDWIVELHHHTDRILAESNSIVISSDSWIIDHSKAWFNLAAYIFKQSPPIHLVKC